jgi:hypothetical protein
VADGSTGRPDARANGTRQVGAVCTSDIGNGLRKRPHPTPRKLHVRGEWNPNQKHEIKRDLEARNDTYGFDLQGANLSLDFLFVVQCLVGSASTVLDGFGHRSRGTVSGGGYGFRVFDL